MLGALRDPTSLSTARRGLRRRAGLIEESSSTRPAGRTGGHHRRNRLMYRRYKERFGTVGVALGVIALILALGGTALAASGALTGKQKKEVEKIAKKYAGKPGAPGAPGTAGTNGTNGTNGKDGAPGAKGGDGTDG